MDIFEAIHTRRSIRKFNPDKPVPQKLQDRMLAAAMTAPSAGNAQPWQFIVVDERETLDALSTLHPYVGMLKTAPLAVVVCGDLSLEKFAGYWVVDCSAAVQNLLLAAHGLGLGAVWTGVHPMAEREQAVAKMFSLPEQVKPHSIVPIGYPAQESTFLDRYKSERVHRNSW